MKKDGKIFGEVKNFSYIYIINNKQNNKTMKKAFNSFLWALLGLNLFMILFSVIIGEHQGALIFGIFAIINFLTLNFDIFIEDVMSFLNKVVNLFGGFKTF